MLGATKYLGLDPVSGGHKEYAVPTVSSGAASAGLPIGLDANGQLDVSVFPPQLGVQTAVVTAMEALAAGALVNLYGSRSGNGTFSARNADAATGKQAHGFVRAAVAANAQATVNVDGVNDALTGLVPGRYYLGTSGQATQTLPSGSGTLLQILGAALSATQLDLQPNAGTVLV